MSKRLFLLVFILFQSLITFSQEDWKLIKDLEGIKVFTKREGNNKFETFKGTITIKSSIHNFISVLNTIDIFPKWGHNIKEANLLEKSGDTLQVYYSVAKVPFPYKNRDGIYLNRLRWLTETSTLMVDIEILDKYLALDDKYERVKGKGYWKIIELSKGLIQVIFSMQIDPGGSIPAWMVNMFVEDTPYNTLYNLRELLESDGYKKYTYQFID